MDVVSFNESQQGLTDFSNTLKCAEQLNSWNNRPTKFDGKNSSHEKLKERNLISIELIWHVCYPWQKYTSIFQASKIKMTFGDLSSDAGVKALNTFLGDASYIEGWVFETFQIFYGYS